MSSILANGQQVKKAGSSLFACVKQEITDMPTADIILQNASVITMEPGQPRAEAVAIKGDSILLVASREEVEPLRGARTRVIDCQGKTVVPGFNDAHCHIFSFVRKLLSLDLSPASVGSIGDIKAVIRRQVENTPSGEWITGTDYNEFYLAEKRHPNRWDLDEVAPHHPVFLTHRSLHAGVLNSRALSLAGITAETTEPPGGIMDRDLNTGEPTGLLFEMVGHLRERVLPPLSEAEIRKGISLVSQHYLSLGLTSVQDATVVNDFRRWETINRLKNAGEL
ncbi:MAG: amidohydrolase family protein, partial [Chloroflexi bacterium]|nr:amidohydrolase family protein [Chloroflexota bacterium]